jgi:hypothetical protein
MSAENPYELTAATREEAKPESTKSAQAAYNIVTDVVTGVNVRKSDNLFQLKCIGICALLGAPVGSVVAGVTGDGGFVWLAGAIVGAFLGVVIGLFGSGIFLMIYRAQAHIKGKHD